MTEKTFFELLEIGMTIELGTHTFGATEVIEFAKEFDPQPFHLNNEAAEKSNFGSLCASGWHTLSVWMGLNIENGRSEWLRVTGFQGKPVFGTSPGVRNVKWRRPVFVGDTISFRSTMTGKRTTPKRPGWGMVMSLSEGFNQHGDQVFKMDGAVTLRVE